MTPINAKTGKEYTGGNIVLLAQNDLSESIWATYRKPTKQKWFREVLQCLTLSK